MGAAHLSSIMAAITHDLSRLDPDTRGRIIRKLQDKDAAQYDLARIEQAKVAKLYNEAAGPGTTKNGFGPLNMVVTPYFRGYLRRLYGDSCFEDPDFVRWLNKEEEWFRVRETGTKIQVGFTRDTDGGKRFTKRYEN